MSTAEELAARVVVDCSEPATRPVEEALADLNKHIKAGDLPAMRDTLDLIEKLLTEEPDTVQYLDLTAEELVQHELDAKDALEDARNAKRANVRAALAATDHWIIRAHEDGKPVAEAKAAHRAKLRAVFAAIDAAADFLAVDAIEIPAPPA